MAYQTFFDLNAYQQTDPYTYQYQQRPYIQQPQYQTPVQPMMNKNVYDWVQGDNAAKAYPVAVGQSMILIDADHPFMYQKTTDVTGKPQQLKYFTFSEISEDEYKAYFNGQNDSSKNQVDLSNYVRRDEIERLVSEATARAIEKQMSEMSFRATTATPAPNPAPTSPVILS